MSDEKRLETLSEEIKLLKGEIKNSLTSVRDYLLNMELLSSEFSTILAALSGDNSGQKVNLDGGLGKGPNNAMAAIDEGEDTIDDMTQPPPDENLLDLEQPEDLLDNIPEGEPLSQDEDQTEDLLKGEEAARPEDGMAEETEETINPDDSEEIEETGLGDGDGAEEEIEEEMVPVDEAEEESEELDDVELDDEELDDVEEPEDKETELPELDNEESGIDSEVSAEEELPMELERITNDIAPGTPRVNMLANLINWVSRAKKEIGDELLSLPGCLRSQWASLTRTQRGYPSSAERTKEKPNRAPTPKYGASDAFTARDTTGGDAPLNPIPSERSSGTGAGRGNNRS